MIVTCRLEGEARVEKVIKRVQEYLEKKLGDTNPEILCRVYIRRIEHLYYKVCECFDVVSHDSHVTLYFCLG